jgi:hypothetical protein
MSNVVQLRPQISAENTLAVFQAMLYAEDLVDRLYDDLPDKAIFNEAYASALFEARMPDANVPLSSVNWDLVVKGLHREWGRRRQHPQHFEVPAIGRGLVYATGDNAAEVYLEILGPEYRFDHDIHKVVEHQVPFTVRASLYRVGANMWMPHRLKDDAGGLWAYLGLRQPDEALMPRATLEQHQMLDNRLVPALAVECEKHRSVFLDAAIDQLTRMMKHGGANAGLLRMRNDALVRKAALEQGLDPDSAVEGFRQNAPLDMVLG